MSAHSFVRRSIGGVARRLTTEAIPHGPAGRSVEAALRRLCPPGGVRTVIDVGASDGRWSTMAQRHLPDASFLLLEAQGPAHERQLRRLRERDPRFEYVIAAAGPREGTAHFDATDPFGGLASEEPLAGADVPVPMTTVDVEVARHAFPGPYLLKLDTHGYEVPILEGATATLRDAALLVIEAYNFEVGASALRFPQLIAHLEARGFRCVDLVDLLYRPRDGALWQMDVVLAPATSGVFDDRTYR